MVFCSNLQHFCFICGEIIHDSIKRGKSDKFKTMYEEYYESQERKWSDDEFVPQSGCSNCLASFSNWYGQNAETRQLGTSWKPRFKEPMTWFNPGNHDEEQCYCCVNYVKGATTPAKRHKIKYVATINTVLPTKHNKASPPITLPQNQPRQQDVEPMDMDIEPPSEFDQPSTSSEYIPPRSINTNPILVNQMFLNHMARKLELSQRKSAVLASLLKNNNLLDEGVTISSQKNRQAEFIQYFKTENQISFCSDIRGLMQALHIEYDIEDWRLFIDASKSGLKAVLLHNDNVYMPVPVAYSRVLKETYESMRLIFQKVKYEEHNWDVSGDLKVVALIMGLQLGRTKNSCFICTWISTAKIDHYSATWEKRSTFEIGIMNVKENSLVKPEKILLPTLHIKLGLIASFIRKIKKDDDAFKYLKILFPKLSIAKISAGKCSEQCFANISVNHDPIIMKYNIFSILRCF